jgi:hypothetical protein
MNARGGCSKNKGQFVREIMGCQIIRKGAGQVMPPRDKGTPRAPRRKKGQELIMHSPAYAMRVALLPATKTNATAQKIGTPPEKSFHPVFCPGAQLAARFGPLNESEGPVSDQTPFFGEAPRGDLVGKEQGKS